MQLCYASHTLDLVITGREPDLWVTYHHLEGYGIGRTGHDDEPDIHPNCTLLRYYAGLP